MSDLVDGHTVEWNIISGDDAKPATPIIEQVTPSIDPPVTSTAAMLRLRDWMMR